MSVWFFVYGLIASAGMQIIWWTYQNKKGVLRRGRHVTVR